MQSISPVFTESEVQFEKKVAEHQEECFTIIGLPVSLQLIDRESGKPTYVDPWGMSFRFRLTDDERAAVAAGKDLILTQLNFGRAVTPMNVQFCGEGERPFFGETPALPVKENVIEMSGTMIDEARIPQDLPSAEEADCPSGRTLDEVIAETEHETRNREQGDGFTE